jgi:hypothetical protein
LKPEVQRMLTFSVLITCFVRIVRLSDFRGVRHAEIPGKSRIDGSFRHYYLVFKEHQREEVIRADLSAVNTKSKKLLLFFRAGFFGAEIPTKNVVNSFSEFSTSTCNK